MAEMTLSEELKWRGFINQTTLDKLEKLNTNKYKFYHGYDASSDSLTIGNLAAIMMDRVFLRHDCKGVALAGGATSLIGDPGGKDSERPLQSSEIVEANVAKVRDQLKRLLPEAEFVNNLDWFKSMHYITFLRDIGKHFSMTPLVQRDYIAKRMGAQGSGISYTEFSYTIMQGYDYLQLFDKHGVNLQLAGSDQWGNSLSGVDLIKKTRDQVVHVLTCPIIINQSTGKKFGKSEEGAIWLSPTKTTPVQFYQFWVNVDDEGVESYLKIFTEMSKSEVEDTMKIHKSDRSKREAQFILADKVTTLVHSKAAADNAKEVTKIITNNVSVEDITSKQAELLMQVIPGMPVKSSSKLFESLVSIGLATSNTEAKRLVSGGSIYFNHHPIKSDRETIDDSDFVNGLIIVRRGKAYKDSAIFKKHS